MDAIYWFFDFFVSQRLAIEAALVAEFCAYWSHRAMHAIPLLWRLHKVHHSSERLDWLASARFHPLESAWNSWWRCCR